MKVIKKSGKQEEFSVKKLLNSIRAANAGTDEPLKPALIEAEFQQIIKGKELITTQQIDIIIYGLLYSKGLAGTLENYITYEK